MKKPPDLINKCLIGNDFEIEHLIEDTYWVSEMHFHDYYECMLCIDGNVSFQVENYTVELPPSSLIVLKPNQLHRPILHGVDIPYNRYILRISPAMLEAISTQKSNFADSFQLNRFNPRRLSFAEKQTLISLFEESLRRILSSDEFGSDILIRNALTETLIIICRLFLKYNPDSELTVVNSKLTAEVIRYIESRLHENICLDDLAVVIHLSKQYLSRVFKQETGISIYKFILQKRIIRAREFLLQGRSPTDICYLCGFNDYSNFYRAFRNEYGISPREYQKYFFGNERYEYPR